MLRKTPFLLAFLFTLFNSIHAQNISGVIVDSKTKVPLAFVNIVYGQSNLVLDRTGVSVPDRSGPLNTG